MTKQNEQNLAINVVINLAVVKNLLKQMGLCNSDCDCGCADNAVKACNSDCDCGCVDNSVKACNSDCDCGCADPATQLCGCEKCDKGCYDPAVQANGCGKCEKGCADPASELKEQIELSGCGKCDKGCYDPASKIDACNSDCDCGCADPATQLCGCEKCDKGCYDPAVQANGCGKCDKGCADPASELEEQIELSGCGKCGNGCYDPASKIDVCNSDCDCGCVDNSVKACNSDCDCGCKDQTCYSEATSVNQSQNDGGANQSISGGDDDGSDEKSKCGCGCEHHNHHHNHHHHHNNGEHHHEHCNCGCEQHNHENACQSEKNLADEYLNLARQVQADFDNYRRRNVEAIKQAKNDGMKQAVMEFLPSLDVVDRAMQFMHDDDSKQGLALIRKMFEKAFSDLNIEPIRCVGAHYNPEFHDVVISEESDQPSGTIIEEIETGYTLDGKVIKHSVVKIAK